MTINADFEGGSFSISDLDIDDNPVPGENPTVTFKLKTDWGEEMVTEFIIDGHMPHCDGAWIDCIETAPDEYEDKEDLFTAVNEILNRYVWWTGLNITDVRAAAAKLGFTVEPVETEDPLIKWALYDKENERVFLGISLHQIQHELSQPQEGEE